MAEFSLKKIDYPESLTFRSRGDNTPFLFYTQAFSQSIELKFHLGYFSSSAINVLALGFAKFISNGGKMKLIINQFLSPKDKDMLIKGETSEPKDFGFSWRNFKEIKESLSSRGEHFFNCVAFLISKNRIEIVVVEPTLTRGIEHPKSGVFNDGTNKIYFSGSCNFSQFGILENKENITVRQGWSGHIPDIKAIEEEEAEFDKIFSHQDNEVRYLSSNEIVEVISSNYSGKELEDLIKEETKLLQDIKQSYTKHNKTHKILNELEKDLDKIIHINLKPFFPYEKRYEFQIEAYNNWKKNNYQGIFAMATGTGKTVTALNCLLNLYDIENGYLCLIVVPTEILLKQWKKECKKFNFRKIILVSSKHPNWMEKLILETEFLKNDISRSFVIISTYQSFAKDKFQRILGKLTNNVLFICDEAHNLGSSNLKELLPSIELKKRIALSATPSRYYDPKGTQAIEAFFNDKEPYIANYSLGEAIAKKILCQYHYYPRFVTLEEEEFNEYHKITASLMKYFNSQSQSFSDNPNLEKLLLKRKRIIHKAKNKKKSLIQTLIELETIKGNLDYTLVFVPEGYDVDYGINEEPVCNDEYNKLTNTYAREIINKFPSCTVEIYESATSYVNKEGIINGFESGKVSVLCSMRCLDEGVDIPRIEAAVFCSSTGNPRQFIQRRGRVLRTHDLKPIAYIFDLIVKPPRSINSDHFDLERNLLIKEMERVASFAFLAWNNDEALGEIKEICSKFNIDIFAIKDKLNL